MTRPEPVAAAPGLVEALCDLARAAGAVILDIQAGPMAVSRKADASPVTQADHAAEAVILDGLARHAPGVPVVAEEAAEAGLLPGTAPPRFFLVDPLDGTKDFVAGGTEFTVNIALVEGGRPVLGVILAPASGELYWNTGPSTAWRSAAGGRAERICCRACPEGGPVAVASRSHRDAETDAYLRRHRVPAVRSFGSSLKFCRIAEGVADLYPRFGPTMEWDTAAGHAILSAAGGTVTTLDGTPLTYGKPGFRNGPFIARGPAAVAG